MQPDGVLFLDDRRPCYGLLERKKENKTKQSRASLILDQGDADNGERARARDKNKQTKKTNFVRNKTDKFYSGGEKMRNVSGQ